MLMTFARYFESLSRAIRMTDVECESNLTEDAVDRQILRMQARRPWCSDMWVAIGFS